MSVSWALPKDHWRSNSPSSCCCRVRQSGSMRSTLSGRVWSAHARENFFFLSARVAVSSHPLSLRRPALSYSFVVTPPPPFRAELSAGCSNEELLIFFSNLTRLPPSLHPIASTMSSRPSLPSSPCTHGRNVFSFFFFSQSPTRAAFARGRLITDGLSRPEGRNDQPFVGGESDLYTSATNSTFSFSGLSPLDVSAEEASRPIASHIQKKEGEREKKKAPRPRGYV